MVKLREANPKQHFTNPPPRYTEASAVKALEEHGIGRPSTYASVMKTLQVRSVRRPAVNSSRSRQYFR